MHQPPFAPPPDTRLRFGIRGPLGEPLSAGGRMDRRGHESADAFDALSEQRLALVRPLGWAPRQLFEREHDLVEGQGVELGEVGLPRRRTVGAQAAHGAPCVGATVVDRPIGPEPIPKCDGLLGVYRFARGDPHALGNRKERHRDPRPRAGIERVEARQQVREGRPSQSQKGTLPLFSLLSSP